MKKRIDISKDWYDVESIEITKRIYAIGVGRKFIS